MTDNEKSAEQRLSHIRAMMEYQLQIGNKSVSAALMLEWAGEPPPVPEHDIHHCVYCARQRGEGEQPSGVNVYPCSGPSHYVVCHGCAACGPCALTEAEAIENWDQIQCAMRWRRVLPPPGFPTLESLEADGLINENCPCVPYVDIEDGAEEKE